MSTTPAPLSLSLPDGSLRVEFIWREDRFTHELVMADGTRVASLQGDANQAWPPSPPIQQLSKELISESYALLGVGAAGQGHWSLSVEMVADDRQQALKFDVACRSKVMPLWLGSTYQACDALQIDPALGSEIVANGNGLVVIEPAEVRANETIRWGYRVAFSGT